MDGKYICPLCGTEIKCEEVNGTYIWVCRHGTCPHISFEFYDERDLQNLTKRLIT